VLARYLSIQEAAHREGAAERAPGVLRSAVMAPKHRLDSGYRGFLQ
jgi:hypothetical protein